MNPKQLTLSDFRACSNIQPRWNDNDIYGHINNAEFYAYADTTVNNWLIAGGVLDVNGSPIGLVVESGCQYFAPMTYPGEILTGLRVVHMGTTSVHYEIGFFADKNAKISALCRFVHVYVDAKTRRPQPLPEPLKTRLCDILVT